MDDETESNKGAANMSDVEKQDAGSESDLNELLCGAFGLVERTVKDGEECSIGCRHHVRHRCEKCARYAARGDSTFLESRKAI
jgi:hypothetical protein